MDYTLPSVEGKKKPKKNPKDYFFKPYFPVKLFSRHSTLRDSKLICVLMPQRSYTAFKICFVLLLFLK